MLVVATSRSDSSASRASSGAVRQDFKSVAGYDVIPEIHPLVRCLSGLNVHFCKKSPKLAQMTFDRYLSNPDIGRTFCGGLTPSN